MAADVQPTQLDVFDGLPNWTTAFGGKMTGNVKNKIKKYIELDLVVKLENGWDVLPIPKRSVTSHLVMRYSSGWTCDCQGYTKKGLCSHIYAVMMYEGMMRVPGINTN